MMSCVSLLLSLFFTCHLQTSNFNLESSFPSKPANDTSWTTEFDGTNVLCRVCGDKASGFHYGVHSCEGCKVSTLVSIVSFFHPFALICSLDVIRVQVRVEYTREVHLAESLSRQRKTREVGMCGTREFKSRNDRPWTYSSLHLNRLLTMKRLLNWQWEKKLWEEERREVKQQCFYGFNANQILHQHILSCLESVRHLSTSVHTTIVGASDSTVQAHNFIMMLQSCWK